MQAELLPTTNTLGQVTDTIRQIADTLIRPEIGENISATIGNGSSSGKTGLAIAIVGLLIFAAHLFSSLFSKRRIPDVLFLIIIGLVIGPILHWITPEMLGGVGRIFTGITWCLSFSKADCNSVSDPSFHQSEALPYSPWRITLQRPSSFG